MDKGKGSLRHGSLFSGIGGFDLASERMGWTNVFNCDTSPFCRQILNYYFPEAKSYENIKKTYFKNTRGKSISLPEDSHVNPIVSPANDWGQPIERHLWPQMLRAIQEIMPTWVVAENVLGIVNWNDGLVFEEVQTDLETQVYQVQSADDQ